MKLKNLYGKLALAGFMALTLHSCKKENGIDNNNVVQRPYALYAVDSFGYIYHSNDGNEYETVFPGDGTPLRALTVIKNKIFIVKGDLVLYSTNEGRNFNPIEKGLVNVPKNIPNANFILSVPSLDRVYITNFLSIRGKISQSPYENNDFAYFLIDSSFTDADTPFQVQSFAYTDNQILYGLSNTGSVNNVSKLYYKTGKDEKWKPQVTNLPSMPNLFYLNKWGNAIVATDFGGIQGAWYSNDTGKNFTAFTGLPVGVNYPATCAAYDKLLIGTEKMGVYLYNGSSFEPSNSGLPSGTSVFSIVAKDNYYKNGQVKKYFYIATNKGLYRSEDLAKSWVKVKDGKYTIVN